MKISIQQDDKTLSHLLNMVNLMMTYIVLILLEDYLFTCSFWHGVVFLTTLTFHSFPFSLDVESNFINILLPISSSSSSCTHFQWRGLDWSNIIDIFIKLYKSFNTKRCFFNFFSKTFLLTWKIWSICIQMINPKIIFKIFSSKMIYE